ncbi:MAG: hypothetical protein PHE10_09065, partial [Kiritimatiellae bacterium]|nr:hypothetical protein [Kiritimatiellia bacterium]
IWSAAASGIPRDAALARTGRKAVPRPARSAALVTALQVASCTKQVRRRFRKEPMFTSLCPIHARSTAVYRLKDLLVGVSRGNRKGCNQIIHIDTRFGLNKN